MCAAEICNEYSVQNEINRFVNECAMSKVICNHAHPSVTLHLAYLHLLGGGREGIQAAPHTFFLRQLEVMSTRMHVKVHSSNVSGKSLKCE